MAGTVELLNPAHITPNPDNPRLIFRLQELEELEESIASQGILVPLSVYTEGKSRFVILDGERRWRCARKLGLHRVPAIVQPKPPRVQNIMMMFAIHNARRDWDPLPTALKLQTLEAELEKIRGRKLTETELAASASLSRGAVRRYRKILRIPADLQKSLLEDLADPRSKEAISVDQVIEAVDAADKLAKVGVIEPTQERPLVNAFIQKFRSGTINSTVEPRKIGAVGRAVDRGEVQLARVKTVIRRFMTQPTMSIGDVVSSTTQAIEKTKTLQRGLAAFEQKWLAVLEEDNELATEFEDQIRALISRLRALL
ncbi:ParB/RepB/Spo0J family partition protein [Reyranella massiliensis]|uniref:ParB/RepB/Spo0J family partition protein n=1 Tax=Reyranella massiliensis TaxID=445220 RepID=UPI0006ACE21F|nr:ParB/RepB/Spo0J family partition protein [Reyranella massiliensis]